MNGILPLHWVFPRRQRHSQWSPHGSCLPSCTCKRRGNQQLPSFLIDDALGWEIYKNTPFPSHWNTNQTYLMVPLLDLAWQSTYFHSFNELCDHVLFPFGSHPYQTTLHQPSKFDCLVAVVWLSVPGQPRERPKGNCWPCWTTFQNPQHTGQIVFLSMRPTLLPIKSMESRAAGRICTVTCQTSYTSSINIKFTSLQPS